MGGEGSMSYAINSLKQNRALLRKRNIKELRDLLLENSGKTELAFKEISPEELAKIKDKIRAQAKKDARQNLLISIGCFIATLTILYFTYQWLNT